MVEKIRNIEEMSFTYVVKTLHGSRYTIIICIRAPHGFLVKRTPYFRFRLEIRGVKKSPTKFVAVYTLEKSTVAIPKNAFCKSV